MLTLIDNFLNKITMYRVVLYYLIALLIVALVLSLFNQLPFSSVALIYTTFFVIALCWIANYVSGWFFNVPTNVESVYITALILVLIITPIQSLDLQYIGFVMSAAFWSQASKYIFAAYKKHFFNPAAFAVVLTAIFLNQSASWWIGTAWMLPFVVIGGLLMVRKLRRTDLVASFLITALVVFSGFILFKGQALLPSIEKFFLSSPIMFFAFIMLTEPLTTPPTKKLRIVYGALTGLLYAPQIHIGSIFSTPELSLLVGNVFSYIVSPKKKLLLTLKQRLQLAPDVVNFVFTSDTKLNFTAGQYLEWTVGHHKSDNRGNRRYFTIASSPTESELMLGAKFYNPASSFKRAMLSMPIGQQILAGQLAGDFTLSKNQKEKSVFIAGGIGITPYRSIVKNLIDTNQKRDIVLLYSNKTDKEIVYKDIFDEAAQKIGLKTFYALTEQAQIPSDWEQSPNHITGLINADVIQKSVPDFKNRVFYISGPHGMVTAFEKTLTDMGVPKNKIKIDFFPGFV